MRTVVVLRSRITAATRANCSDCSSSRSRAVGCSWISARKRSPASLGAGACAACASEGDTVRALDEDALELEVFGQNEDVRRQADGEPADAREAKDARGHLRRGVDR